MFRGALMWISRLIVTGSSHRSVQSGIRGFSERLVEAGTADKVDLVECMRELHAILNAMMRTHTSWRQMDHHDTARRQTQALSSHRSERGQ